MYKRIIALLVILFISFGFNTTYSAAPEINCIGLPGCVDGNIMNPGAPDIGNNIGAKFMANIIGEFIQIVAVFAVFALIFSGIMYLLSAGEEEKATKAKKWIIWSLVGVFVSISAWGIINFLNNIRINSGGTSSSSSSSTSVINFRIGTTIYDTRTSVGDQHSVPNGLLYGKKLPLMNI
ncbi:MAG: pilin [Candidatus Gracilibacteria bacterium]|nr:pilin [Candidatus Gracilibacteria bacterium]